MQEWVSIYETNECDIGIPDIYRFRKLTGCQRDPWDKGVTKKGEEGKKEDF